jgi:aspartate ammonia-lyase
MNANEVIANRALELMGHKKGEYTYCSPHDHVNCSQSTNDAYPTALHVGMALGNIELVASMRQLIATFRAKGKEFASILKMGRTQLQDAVPMTLGDEFSGYAAQIAGDGSRVDACLPGARTSLTSLIGAFFLGLWAGTKRYRFWVGSGLPGSVME